MKMTTRPYCVLGTTAMAAIMLAGAVQAETVCVFRGDAPTGSDLMRPRVPISSARRFRGIRPPL